MLGGDKVSIVLTPLWLNVAIALFGAFVNGLMGYSSWQEKKRIALVIHSVFVVVFAALTVQSVVQLLWFR